MIILSELDKAKLLDAIGVIDMQIDYLTPSMDLTEIDVLHNECLAREIAKLRRLKAAIRCLMHC